MQWLIAGTGSIGRRHIASIQALEPPSRFLLLRADQRRDAFADALEATVVPDLASALSHGIDAMVIATPSSLHADLVVQGLQAGVPMYVEKPVVTSPADLLLVQAAVDGQSRPVASQVGCNLRFLPSLLHLAELLRAGAIGRVVRASFEAGQWLPDWRPQQDHRRSYSGDPALGGGVILDLVHEIDAARWLLGALTPVAAQCADVPSLAIGSEGAAAALCRSASGVLVQLGLDYVARRPLRRYQLIGEAGTLCWDLPRRELVLETAEQRHMIDCGPQGFDVSVTYRTAMAEFLDAVSHGAATSQPLQDGLQSAALAIKVRELAWANH